MSAECSATVAGGSNPLQADGADYPPGRSAETDRNNAANWSGSGMRRGGRPCRLVAGPLKDASDWLEQYRRFWEESFDRLDDYLRELQGPAAGAAKIGKPGLRKKEKRNAGKK